MTAITTRGPARPRRFQLGDAMILTAAAALAMIPPSGEFLLAIPIKLAAWRSWLGHILGWEVIPRYLGIDLWPFLIKDAINFGIGLAGNALVPLLLAVIAVRLRGPRPCRAALFRQPGFVACLAAPAGLAIGLEANDFGASIRPELAIASAIAAAWAWLALRGRWEAEPGWIDRLGRAVGLGFLVSALGQLVERSI